MIVTFHHPPTGTFNPFNDFKPNIINHYPSGPGIYIYGLRLKIDKQGKKFVPLYVGIAGDLQKRLWQHYREEKTAGNSKKEIFNLSSIQGISDIRTLYTDMSCYDSLKKSNINRLSISSLIWFNNSKFFDLRLGGTSSKYYSNSGCLTSICQNGDLDMIHSINSEGGADILKSQILATKTLFDDDFYFVYAKLDTLTYENGDDLITEFSKYSKGKQYIIQRKNGPGKTICERVELSTKIAMKKISINTTAKAVGKSCSCTIDLTNIQNELINVGGHVFDEPYKAKSLIIKIP